MTGAQIELLYVREHSKDIPPSTILALIEPDRSLEKAKEELKNGAETEVRKILEKK